MSTRIYHITHLRNLHSILNSGGLLSKRRLQGAGATFQDISHENIQERRSRIHVPFGSKGSLHDYVPFYFAPRPPMLYSIHCRNVRGCPEGQTPILHLVTTVEKINATNLEFVFTDGHAIMKYSYFYNSLEELSNIDWEIMQAKYWADTEEDGDRERRRQAEFLIHEFLPWSFIIGIGVFNKEIQNQTEQILQDMNQTTPVRVYRKWYY